ncbi:DnaE-like DNA polymerase III alpha [Streptomyces phage Annadreamy]|uniref:DNA-directed DNA polymerase n=2 Tax=Annadreamyvirus annadreamy TaxID=2846392 RepID=A0A345GTA6_9CAUD|nr:DNA polymerase [Streptomyces phage Annadreamy]AXG66178.1 DnaE-like DNA polymerase III alpha [Streptomyces phage Annadreamy]QGH79390.1 DnaE-like DNA polymerase III alpha [Streptomyces phage Limpid]
MAYTELHLHDYYSTLDGLNSPAEYMERAKELGMTHLAQTNHGSLIGHREFQKAASAAGIVPILGVEAYISPTDRFDRRAKNKRSDGTNVYNHLIILAQGETGLKTLNTLNEIAWTEGFYNKPRIDMEVLEEHNEGLIVLSGCLNSMLCKALDAGNYDEAERIALEFKRILGDRFYIEVQGHNPLEINQGLFKIADDNGIPPVVTSDCHYARKEDLWIEEAMLIISSKPKFGKEFDFSKSQKMDLLERYNYLYPDRMMSFEEIEIYLHSAEEHRAAFKKQGFDREDIVKNTEVISQRIGDYPFYQGLDLLPRPKNGNPDDLLEKKARSGLRNRGLDKNPEYVARLEEELDIIKSKDFSTYFLIVANMIKWAKDQGIFVGPGRGSGAGSLVNYSLGITEVDPIKYGLLFFRFINPERNDFPDIDTDFEDRRRNEIKDYLTRKFHHVASIATVGYFKNKGVIRRVAGLFRIDQKETDKALETIETFEEYQTSSATEEYRKKYPEVEKVALELRGRISNTGMHAAGIVISKEPIAKYAAMETAADPKDKTAPRRSLVAMDMEEAADLGLIKVDALGLKTLSVIGDALKVIKERHNRDIILTDIPLEDKKVYEMISKGYTKGVFQCEATPYTGLILNMGGIHSFAELAASNALVRPGAMNTIGAEYIARKNGETPVTYVHELMKPFTEDTYGEVLYQEQVMLAMTELAGMSMATADKVRKIIGKKKDASEFDAYKAEFINGASQHISKAVAEKLWHDFEAHAGYSFNKSHAVAYSMLSYWTAWLKYYYPVEFVYAMLKNENDKDARTTYLIEAKRMGVKVKLPHINHSQLDFSIEDDAIRFGLANIKFISDNLGKKLIDARPFENYAALEEEVKKPKNGLSVRVLQSLNAIGGATFPDNPKRGDERHYFYEYLQIPAFEIPDMPAGVRAQFTDLADFHESGNHVVMGMVKEVKRGKGWSRIEIVDETGEASFFHKEDTLIQPGNMYVMLIANKRLARYVEAVDFVRESSNTFVRYMYTKRFAALTEGFYYVVSNQSRKTKAGKNMADLVLADEEKNLYSVLVFPQMFHKAYGFCKEGSIIEATLKQTQDGDTLFLDEVIPR